MQLMRQNKPSISPKNWVRFWVRFLSLFVHICPFTQITKASKIGSLCVENIGLSFVRQKGFEPPTLYIGFKDIFMFLKLYLSNSQSRSSQPRVEARPKPDPADCFVLRSPNSRQGHCAFNEPVLQGRIK